MYCSRLLQILWSVDATQDELVSVCASCNLTELLNRLKSVKFGFYGRRTVKCESLEKEIVQGCVPGEVRKYIYRGRECRHWTDDIAEWTGMKISEAATTGEDRNPWRGILHVRPRRQPFLWKMALKHEDEEEELT